MTEVIQPKTDIVIQSALASTIQQGQTEIILPTPEIITFFISLLISSGGIATATTEDPHGLPDDVFVVIVGADQQEYNGAVLITVTGPNSFTYTISGTPQSPATGSSRSVG